MSFTNVLGHERQTELLQKAVLSGNVSHAYLFHGPEGVGKKLAAYTLAQALNCERKDGDACGQCRSCLNIQKGAHPDVLFLQPEEGYIRIEEIRAVQKMLGYRAFEGGWKIAIMEGCDEMSIGAANSFLKTLEEPPDRTTIILICSNYHSLLPTIFSRCQRIRFNPLHGSLIQDILIKTKGMAPETACAVACLADGSLGRAFSMDLHEAMKSRNDAFDLISGSEGRDVVDLFALGRKISGMKEELNGLLCWMLTLARDLAVVKITEERDLIKNKDLLQKIESLAKRLSHDALQRMFESINGAIVSLQRHANPQLAMDHLLISLTRGD